MEMIKYGEVCNDKSLVQKAEKIREMILGVLPDGVSVYKLLGLKTKKITYPRSVRTIKEFTKPENVNEYEKDLSSLSKAQIGYFGNLTNIKSLENLKDVVPSFNIVVDPIDNNNHIFIMCSEEKDSLGRITLNKQGIIFRPYNEQEEEEYKLKLEQKEAEEATGYNADVLKMAKAMW